MKILEKLRINYEYAELVPQLSEASYRELEKSIEENGSQYLLLQLCYNVQVIMYK